jgi:hypothetical protein
MKLVVPRIMVSLGVVVWMLLLHPYVANASDWQCLVSPSPQNCICYVWAVADKWDSDLDYQGRYDNSGPGVFPDSGATQESCAGDRYYRTQWAKAQACNQWRDYSGCDVGLCGNNYVKDWARWYWNGVEQGDLWEGDSWQLCLYP